MKNAARALVLLGLSLALAAAARGHYIDLRGKLVEDGVLTVGMALTGRPFTYREDGVLRGFEVDLAAALAHSRGLQVKHVKLPRRRLAAALAAGEVDLVNSFAFGETKPDGIVVVPYMLVGDHMMVLKGNPFRLRGPADLAGRTVAATAGTSAEAFAREINERLVANGAAPMNIHSFLHQRDTHFPVSMGHAAAYFVGTASAVLPGLDPHARVRPLQGVFRARREVGFAVRADNPELEDALAHAVAAKVANGAYDALRAEYGIPDDLSPFR